MALWPLSRIAEFQGFQIHFENLLRGIQVPEFWDNGAWGVVQLCQPIVFQLQPSSPLSSGMCGISLKRSFSPLCSLEWAKKNIQDKETKYLLPWAPHSTKCKGKCKTEFGLYDSKIAWVIHVQRLRNTLRKRLHLLIKRLGWYKLFITFVSFPIPRFQSELHICLNVYIQKMNERAQPPSPKRH